MSETKTCPACQFENDISETICGKCGVTLTALPAPAPSRITVPVPESLLNSVIPAPPPKKTTQRFDDKLAVYVVGQSKPVLVDVDVKKITFGRSTAGETPMVIDLTPYDAHLYGVSRSHAVIFRSDNGCFLQDLESTNGTWLNEKKLLPQKLYEVTSGDLIRLGQLGLRVYFETESAEYALTLVDEVVPSQRLTPAYLEQRVSPYLVALANAQQMIDAMKDRKIAAMEVLSITLDDKGQIVATITGARDIVRLQESRFAEWRTTRRIMIERLRTLNERVKNEGDTTGEIRAQSEPILKEIRTSLADFARECVTTLAPQLSETLHNTYADKLIAPLQALLFSPLQPVQEPKDDAKEDTAPAQSEVEGDGKSEKVGEKAE
jgi:pSer/pThr/pTyr-binding forkhead associated (FHA) protein